ncbi:MAG: hypothetical protein NTY38_00320 [Acidobacteria bacterium]|nr:hypothetical protein [Acidobacteriota bacterium]
MMVFSWRGWLSNFIFHTSSKPGLATLAGEIFASLRTQDDRCASFAAVTHSPEAR